MSEGDNKSYFIEDWGICRDVYYNEGFVDFFEKYFINKNNVINKNAMFNCKDFVFRGVKKRNYELIPSFHRWFKGTDDYKFKYNASLDGRKDKEKIIFVWFLLHEFNLLRLFYKKCNHNGLHIPVNIDIQSYFSDTYIDASNFIEIIGDKWLPDEFLEFVALAQHYGIPTRMLDWTYNINIAAYFACNSNDTCDDYAIYALNRSISTRIKYEQEILNIEPMPLQFITPRYSDNPNIYAQEGVLTTWQLNVSKNNKDVKAYLSDIDTDENNLKQLILRYCSSEKFRKLQKSDNWDRIKPDVIKEPMIYKFIFPKDDRKNTIDLLKRIGYSTGRLFPGYKGCADEVMEGDYLYFMN